MLRHDPRASLDIPVLEFFLTCVYEPLAADLEGYVLGEIDTYRVIERGPKCDQVPVGRLVSDTQACL